MIKILFADLDGTLITTVSNKTFPEGIWDMQFRFDVLDKIKELKPEYIFIVTNQGGIRRFVSEESFDAKFSFIKRAIRDYTKCTTDGLYCSSLALDNPCRKPNTGLLQQCLYLYNLDIKGYKKEDMLMIGDASGLPGQFSDSDKKTANNFGIDYLDINEFISKKF